MDTSVRALLVVVIDIVPKYSFEMSMAEDEDAVQAFSPNCPHPTFSVGIGPRGSDRRLDDSDPFRSEDLVESRRELCVAIPDQELDRSTSVREIANQVASKLGDECTSRMARHTEDVYFSSRKFYDEEHVELLERHGIHGEEVRGQHAVGLGTQEL
jgi:hypothetical protein